MSGISTPAGLPPSRKINTTAPLTGGGDLSTDRTLGVVGLTAAGRQRVTETVGDAVMSEWTTQASAADNAWRAVTWAPGLSLFAAVAESGTGDRVMTSPDGLVWTARASAADNDWRAITWAPGAGVDQSKFGMFVAVASTGSSDRVMTSPDGIEWTTQASAADNAWQAVAWSPELGLFAAVADSGTGNRVMTSSNGADWTTQASAEDNAWQAIAWSPELGLFAAVADDGSGNRVMTSPDGIDWTAVDVSPVAPDSQWKAIAWSPELRLFTAVADTDDISLLTSSDGTEWQGESFVPMNAIAWAPELNRFAAVAASGDDRVFMSRDGSWETAATAEPNAWRGLAWAPELGLFAAVANTGTGNRVMTSRPMIAPPTPATLGTLSATTASIGGGALLVGQTASGTVSVLGAATGMVVHVSPSTYPGDGSYWYGYVSATGTVTVKVGVVVDGTPTASTYNVRVVP